MKESDFINDFFPFLRGKFFRLICFLVVGLLIALLVRGLIPKRLKGGGHALSGAYGPTTDELGFDIRVVGIQPPERPPTAGFSKIVGIPLEDEETGERYLALAMKHDSSRKDFIVLFNVARMRDILTNEDDKKYGGDTVLTPIALISWNEMEGLFSGNLRVSQIEPTSFPEGCKIVTILRTYMSLKREYIPTRKCYSSTAPMTITGTIYTSYGGLLVDTTITLGKDKYWFGEERQIGKRYSRFGSSIGPVPNGSRKSKDR